MVLCTNTGALDRSFFELPEGHAFDLIVIDEAAQVRRPCLVKPRSRQLKIKPEVGGSMGASTQSGA